MILFIDKYKYRLIYQLYNSSPNNGEDGQTNHEAMRKGKHWQALRQGDESLCNLLERPLQWAGERKLREVNPGERYKHR